MTSHRRVPSIPQLRCVGGSGCRYYKVDTMRCKNEGYDYDPNDVQWTCTASLPAEFKLGSTEVLCEGYSSPTDPYILKGSCGVEYRLALTNLGEEKYGSQSSWGSADGLKDALQGKSIIDILVGSVFWIAFLGVAGWIAFSIIKDCLRGSTRGPTRRTPGAGGGWGGGWDGGGGGGNDDDDAPPPYSRYPKTNYSKSRTYQSSGTRQQQQGWQPGFWTGAATGAAAGYFAGNRGNNRTYTRNTGGGQGWFGGGRSNTDSWDAGVGPSRSSGPSSSGSRYESTGFGGTTRR